MTLKKLKTTYVAINLPLYVHNKSTYITNQSVLKKNVVKDEEIFQHHRKKVSLVGD